MSKIRRITGVLALLAAGLGLGIGGLAGVANAAAPGAVRITEFIADPAVVSDANGEWLEIKNLSAASVDLTGWDVDGSTIIGSIVLAAGGEAVICKNDNAATNDGVVCNGKASGMSFGNTTDTIQLRDDTNAVIDSVSYDISSVSTGHATKVEGGVLSIENRYQYSVNNFGTPRNNASITGEIRVQSIIDSNNNNWPEFSISEPRQAGWLVRLYQDTGTTWELKGQVTTIAKSGENAARFFVPAGDYFLCQVEQAGYTQTFGRSVLGWYTAPLREIPNNSPASDEGSVCIPVNVVANKHSAHVFGNIPSAS